MPDSKSSPAKDESQISSGLLLWQPQRTHPEDIRDVASAGEDLKSVMKECLLMWGQWALSDSLRLHMQSLVWERQGTYCGIFYGAFASSGSQVALFLHFHCSL